METPLGPRPCEPRTTLPTYWKHPDTIVGDKNKGRGNTTAISESIKIRAEIASRPATKNQGRDCVAAQDPPGDNRSSD